MGRGKKVSLFFPAQLTVRFIRWVKLGISAFSDFNTSEGSPMELLDGRLLATQIKKELRELTAERRKLGKSVPHLAAILVGEDPASQAYVRNKVRSCEEVGFRSTLMQQPADLSQDQLLHLIKDFNENPEINGFIVQLPLPAGINATEVTMAINPLKDVDGFHPFNLGRMMLGLPAFLPATPKGILEIIRRYQLETLGKHVVVVGRSHIVGTPISIMLSRKDYPGNATVTLAHSYTRNLGDITLQADILIAATGLPESIGADMIKPGAVVIDVGINRVVDPTSPGGYRLTGDVHFPSVAPLTSFITPVPGGVGQLTVAALLQNTLEAAANQDS